MTYGNTVTTSLSFEEAVALTRTALADQGFGVLTEIDVQATLKAKLDQDMEPYLILGACNPQLAHRALEVERDIGLLLPCNVVVRRDGDQTLVQALDPQVMVSLPGRPELQPVADEATRRFALSSAEVGTTIAAAAVSSGAYLVGGFPYLARGVVGDLLGFAALGLVARGARARVEHEAAVCLAGIGLVLLANPGWPLVLPELAWWGLFTVGLAAYVLVRRNVCD